MGAVSERRKVNNITTTKRSKECKSGKMRRGQERQEMRVVHTSIWYR
jgi:hypothetical protein